MVNGVNEVGREAQRWYRIASRNTWPCVPYALNYLAPAFCEPVE